MLADRTAETRRLEVAQVQYPHATLTLHHAEHCRLLVRARTTGAALALPLLAAYVALVRLDGAASWPPSIAFAGAIAHRIRCIMNSADL